MSDSEYDELLRALSDQTAVLDALEAMDEPHVVLLTFPATGELWVLGPYPDGAAAACAAVGCTDYMNRDDDDDLPFTARPARLWPAPEIE